MRGVIACLAALLAAAGMTARAAAQSHPLDIVRPISPKVTSTIITYPIHGDNPVTVRARFNLPKTASPAHKVPAVVYVHGTSGVDGRGAFNDFALNEAGIATLEMDMWEARGLMPGPRNRFALQPTQPFAYGAFRFLAAQPAIDAARIGIEGESMGGGITLRTASEAYIQHFAQGSVRFAAHLAFYPNCTEFMSKEHLPPMTGAPVHILLGDNDADTSVDDCMALAKQIGAGITVYPGATHQWDEQRGAGFTFYDPLALRGLGGRVTVQPSPALAEQSRAFGASFFRKAFGMP